MSFSVLLLIAGCLCLYVLVVLLIAAAVASPDEDEIKAQALSDWERELASFSERRERAEARHGRRAA